MSNNRGLEMVNEFLVYGRLNQEDKRFLEQKNYSSSEPTDFLNKTIEIIKKEMLYID